MKITVLGRGNVGSGLSRRWQAAGHEVSALGREGGDTTGSDRVKGTQGIPAIDATNAYGGRQEDSSRSPIR